MKRDLKQQAIDTILKYYNAVESVECTDGLSASLLVFLGNGEWGGHAIFYQNIVTSVLTSLAQPDLSALLKSRMDEHMYNEFVKLLDRLLYFAKDMERDHYDALLESYYLELYGDSDNTNYEAVIKKYNAKISGLQLEYGDKLILKDC